jgi:hypothetical protein
MKLTRRQLAAAALASLAAEAQAPAPSPEADLQAARQSVKANADALARYDVPMNTEPVFAFEA